MRINQLESAYRIKKSESQVPIQEKEKSINAILLKGTVAIAVLILILSFVIFNQYRLKRKSSKEIAEAYEQLKTTQEQLIHHKKLASLIAISAQAFYNQQISTV